MNKVILLGRLTKDPELRQTQGGVPVCRFTVAVDRRYQKQGEEKQTDFIGCVAWRQQAEFVAEYFAKGHRICCEGSIQTRSWTDESGKKQYATEVVVDNVEFAQSKSEGRQGFQPVSNPPQMGYGGQAGGYRQGQIDTYVGPAPDGFTPIDESLLPF